MIVVCTLMALTSTACRPATVRLAFAPRPGATYAYVVKVEATSQLQIEEQPVQRRTDTVVLDATHTVLAADGDAVRLRVELRDRAGAVRRRSFVVRFDRAGQLTGIEQLEDVATGLLGDLGLSEIFPAAAGAPPDRRLAPGERWSIDDSVALPGVRRGAIHGAGRLLRLGVEDGRDVATVATGTELRLERERVVGEARTTLTGSQANEALVTHAVADGSVTRARAVTRASYRLRITPSSGPAEAAVSGTLALVVRSSTTRVG